MKLLIDGDMLVYSIASIHDNKRYLYRGEEYKLIKELPKGYVKEALETTKRPSSIAKVHKAVDKKLEFILDSLIAEESQVYLSGKSNFRYKTATILPYKGTRTPEKPFHYDTIRNYLASMGAIITEGSEADDYLGLAQVEEEGPDQTCICTDDKDLNVVPGLHYNITKNLEFNVSLVEADRYFYKQVLTGDSTDNIPGLYNVGAKSAACKSIDTMENEWDMFDLVIAEYRKRFGSYAVQFMKENMQLLWILQKRVAYWQGIQEVGE